MKRGGVLGALLVTAALMICWPGLMKGMTAGDGNRMADSLRPARLRTLTVWLLPGDVEDAGLIASLCAAFEKAVPGARVFLRTAWQGEWEQAEAVLPDVLLFSTGDVQQPEGTLLPLTLGEEQAYSSARSGGEWYALPLWLSPEVLAVPEGWAMGEDMDWARLLGPEGLALPKGVALQQLLLSCPTGLRQQLWALVDQPGRSPQAQVMTLARYRRAQGLTALPLSPAVCNRVRYGGLCRDGTLARDFLSFLWERRADAAEKNLLPLGVDDTVLPIQKLYQQPFLPNAFAHTRQELDALCLDGFRRREDPARTLLGLR